MPDLPEGGISAWFRLLLDKASLAKVRDDIRRGMAGAGKDAGAGVAAGLKSAGEKGGKDAVEAFKKTFNLRIAESRDTFARGLIDRKAFEKQAREAAVAFNRSILLEIDRLGKAGKLTDQRFIELTSSLKDVGTVGTRSFLNLRSAIANATIAGGAFVIGLSAWRMMIRLIEQAATAFKEWGAEISRTQALRDSFDSLAARIGTTADDLLPRLRKAVHYTIQDQDLFALANQAVQLGVVKNAKEMETFARVARILGRAMGGEAVRSVEDMAIALGRQSTRVLDNLGIVLKQAEAEKIYAAQIGKTADQLTDEEKRLAFVTVALQRASQASAGLSKEQITSGERMQQLAVLWETLKTRMMTAVAESPQIRGFFENIGIWAENSSDKIDNFADRFGALIDTILGSPMGRALGGALGVVTAGTVAEGTWVGGKILGVNSEDYRRNLERRRLERQIAQTEAQIAAMRARQGKGGEDPDAKRLAAIAAEVAKLKQAADIRELTAKQIARAAQLERELRAELRKGTIDAETRKTVIEQITTLQAMREEQARRATEAERQHQATLDKQAAALGKLAQYGVLTESQRQVANMLEREYRAELARGNLSLEQRERLMKRIADLQPATLGYADLETAAQRVLGGGTQRTMPLRIPKIGLSGEGGLIGSAQYVKEQNAFQVLAEYYRDGFRNIEGYAQDAARGLAGAFQDAFDVLHEEGATAEKFFVAFGKGIGRAALSGLADLAAGQIARNVAQYFDDMANAASATAMAVMFPFSPNFAAAAAMFTASAHSHLLAIPKWALLGGAAAAGSAALSSGGYGGGGGGGFPTSSSPVGGSEARNPPGAEVHIELYGDFDALNPRVQKVVYIAQQEAIQKFGKDARVTLDPPRRP